MGQDFVARKAAKKQRKRSARDAETGRKKRRRKEDGFEVQGDDDGLGMTAEQVKRKRKKGNNVSLRISRALCYKPPQLTPDDLKWDGTEEGGDGGRNAFSCDDMKESGYDSDVEEALQKGGQPKQQQPPAFKLSTAVNLLDPATAAKLAAKHQTKQQQPQAQQQQRSKQDQQQQLDDQVAAAPALKALIDAGLPAVIGRCMVKLGFTEPTPIQSGCWGPAAAGRDVLGHAEPGSGKTLAYLLPTYAHILSSSSAAATQLQEESGAAAAAAVQPRVLVLLPSRELAQQVHGQCTALFAVTGVSTAVVYGGVPKDQQVNLLQQRKPQLLVATPGRLLDLLDSGALSLGITSLVVLDEADKMLSVGFEPQLQRLKALLLERPAPSAAAAGSTEPSSGKKKGKKQKKQVLVPEAAASGQQCQVLLFSATLPTAVRQTADGWLKAGYASVSCSADADAISNTITQVVQVCAEHKKPTKLLKHLAAVRAAAEGQRNPPRMLVFANRIKTVIFVHRTLTEAGYRAVLLHGKRSQQEREAAVADFKAGKSQVLVASDVASRGLDIRGLPYVVNYDFPSNLEVYIHRVGRTGRLAAAGHAFSFFTRPLAKLAAPLIALLNAHHQTIDPNLLLLSEAWGRAEAALKAQGRSTAALEAAAEEGEEEAEEDEGAANGGVLPEDLQEGLSQEQLAAQAAQAASQAAAKQQQEPKRSKKHAGDAVLVPTARTAEAATAAGGGAGSSGAAVAAAAATAPFMPSAKFAGAKPGYVFKKGSRGVGYYLDSVQQKQLAQQQAVQQRKQEHQAVLQQALKQYKQQQQGQQGHAPAQQDKPKKGKAAAAAASAAAGGSSKAAAAGGSSSKAAKTKEALPLLPGLAKKRKLPAFLAGGDLTDDDGAARDLDGDSGSGGGSESDEGGAGAGPRSMQQRLQRAQLSTGDGSSKRRKALPGRLRKKLAKAAAGGKGSGDSSSAKGKGKGRSVGGGK